MSERTDPNTPPQIKGAGVQGYFSWYAEEHGEERLRDILRRLPPEHRGHFSVDHPTVGILASTWYPAALIHSFLDEMTAGLSREETLDLVRRATRSTMENHLRGIYRLVFKALMNPDRYARMSEAIFSRYFNTGTLTKDLLGPTSHRTKIRDWTSHHPVLCEATYFGGEFVYEQLGCENLRQERTGCISRGDPDCTWRIEWD